MVKDGYKQTEIGVIPKDWNLRTLNDTLELLTDFEANGSFETVAKNVNLYDSSNFAWYVRATDLEKNSNLTEVKYVDKSSYSFLKKTPLYGGEVLITKRGEIGKVYYFKQQYSHATLAPNMYLLKLNTKVVFPQFVYYFFKSNTGNRLLLQKNASSTLGALYKDDVKGIYFPIPEINEQKAIAKALSDTDELITSLEKLIAKKEAMKQGSMQQLLTGKKRLSGFNGNWIEKPIKELVSTPVTDGPHETPKFVEQGIPFLSVNNLVNNKIDLSDLRYISNEYDLLCSRKCKPQKNDLLLGKAASVGKIAIVQDDMDFNIWSPIALIRIKTQYLPLYFYYSFQTRFILSQIDLFTNSSSQGNIGMGDIEKLNFKFPFSLEEQKAITKILSDMDDEIESLKSKLSKTKAIKDGMMHELLTGKTRLKV